MLKNGCITIDEYKATIENGEVTTVEKGSCEGLLVKTGPTSEDPDTTKTKGLLKIVYLDPTDLNKTCTKEMAESNVNEFGTPTGIKSGCMKWYTYKDDGENYTMILDHNTSPHYAWITTNDCSKNNPDNTFCSLLGPISAINKLNSDTENWKYSARLISANEIADLTGASIILDWSADKEFIHTPIVGSSISYYYFDGEDSDDAIWQTKISLTKGANKYSWLFDNTFNCLNNGCNVSDDYEYEYEEEKKLYTFGYWTSDRVNSSNSDIAWWVSNYGEMDYTSTVTANYRVGLRPVIVVPKEDIDY